MLSCCPKSHDLDCFGVVDFGERAAIMPFEEILAEHRDALDCCGNLDNPDWQQVFPAYSLASRSGQQGAEKP